MTSLLAYLLTLIVILSSWLAPASRGEPPTPSQTEAVSAFRGMSDPIAGERHVASAATTRLGPRPTSLPRKPVRHPTPSKHVSTNRASTKGAHLTATWYCGHGSRCTRGYPAGGMYAAISPDLAHWRGHLLRVCASGCVVVRIVDCLCSRMHGIDLYARPFSMIASLSAGRVRVTVALVR